MVKSVQVVSVSSRVPTEPYYRFSTYLESLKRFQFKPVILGMNEPWGGLITKPNLLRNWLRAGKNKADRIIVCDAWDIVFCEHPQSIDERAASLYGDAIVFNAEKACWPRTDLADHFPDTGSPWRFLNNGFFCGPAEKMLACLEWQNLDALGFDRRNADDTGWIYPDDQEQGQIAYIAQPVDMVVDTACELAQCLSASFVKEFDTRGERIRNRITGTTPGVFHFNGGSKDKLMPKFLKKWGLS